MEKNLAPGVIFGEIIATHVTAEEYLEKYAAYFCEWVEGTVIKMAPIHEEHDRITRYLLMFLSAYLTLRPIGQIRSQPFVMRLSETAQREPDIQIILHGNPHEVKPTYMDGPLIFALRWFLLAFKGIVARNSKNTNSPAFGNTGLLIRCETRRSFIV